MRSVSGKNWEEIKVNKRIIEKLKNDLGFDELLSKLIISRKFNQTEIDLIRNRLDIFNPFIGKNDFQKGMEVLANALENKDKILIIGDYDVDGCVSTSLLLKFFKHINKTADFYIPDRFIDGYGASLSLIKKLIKKKPNLIIMVDCGSNSLEATEYLKSKNIKTIIIDHHDINKPYPVVDCLINPKKKVDYQNYDYLCSSSLTYFFIDYFIQKKKLNINFKSNLIYVLLATVCDVMPMRDLNKIIGKNVLQNFNIKNNYLIYKIFSIKKINKPLEIEDLGFLIGPILNSPGRLNNANIVVKLLVDENTTSMVKMINKLLHINEKRKMIEKNLLKEIDFKKISKDKNDVLVEYKTIINEGIIGIIASRLKEEFNKPCVVLTKSNNYYKASARSTSSFNIGKYIKLAIDKNIILKGGGHNLAAGFTIKNDKIDNFRFFINEAFKKNYSVVTKKYISKISLSGINNEFYNNIKDIGPFGQKNLNPIFLIDNIKIIKPKILKNNFLSFFVKGRTNKLFPSVAFTFSESDLFKTLLFNKKEISLIVQIKENFWNNKKKLQLIVLDAITDLNKA